MLVALAAWVGGCWSVCRWAPCSGCVGGCWSGLVAGRVPCPRCSWSLSWAGRGCGGGCLGRRGWGVRCGVWCGLFALVWSFGCGGRRARAVCAGARRGAGRRLCVGAWRPAVAARAAGCACWPRVRRRRAAACLARGLARLGSARRLSWRSAWVAGALVRRSGAAVPVGGCRRRCGVWLGVWGGGGGVGAGAARPPRFGSRPRAPPRRARALPPEGGVGARETAAASARPGTRGSLALIAWRPEATPPRGRSLPPVRDMRDGWPRLRYRSDHARSTVP